VGRFSLPWLLRLDVGDRLVEFPPELLNTLVDAAEVRAESHHLAGITRGKDPRSLRMDPGGKAALARAQLGLQMVAAEGIHYQWSTGLLE